MVRNFYELLNVSPTATFEELKRNYKHLILQCHPDKLQQQQHQQSETKPDSKRNVVTDSVVAVNLCCPSACTTTSSDPNVMLSTTTTEANIRKKFVAINEAWNTLKDPNKRKLYDAELLQTKFQTHSNIYDTITYKEMRREEVEEEIVVEDDTTEVEVAENNIDENHIKTALSDDKENVGTYDDAAAADTKTTSTTSVYYVYDCRCGGQYELDESAYKALQRSSTHKDNKCRRQHHHYDQQQQKESQKTRNFHQVPQSTSVKLTASADNNNVDGVDDADYIDNNAEADTEEEVEVAGNDDNDDDVIVECNECSLLSTPTTTTTTALIVAPYATFTTARLPARPLDKMATTGDIWLQWFSCCFHQPQSPSRRRHQHQRLRIDRSMIGNPTNFVHTGHIGSADVELSTNHLNAISTQMQSKGGYEMNSIRLHAC